MFYSRQILFFALIAVLIIPTLTACQSAPRVRHYHLPVHEAISQTEIAPTPIVLSMDYFVADTVYDDQRLIYRSSQYEFDYDHYNRWASSPGHLMTDYLRQAYQNTNAFRHVIAGHSAHSDIILSGRLIALEEVKQSGEAVMARIGFEMQLREVRTGKIIWQQTIVDNEPMQEQSPVAFVHSVNESLARIVTRTTIAMIDAYNAHTQNTLSTSPAVE